MYIHISMNVCMHICFTLICTMVAYSYAQQCNDIIEIVTKFPLWIFPRK